MYLNQEQRMDYNDKGSFHKHSEQTEKNKSLKKLKEPLTKCKGFNRWFILNGYLKSLFIPLISLFTKN